jgi:hypothetical protein
MRRVFLLAGLAVVTSCGRDSPPAVQTPADSAAVPSVSDSTGPAPGVVESPSADSVMARDTARLM